MKNAKETFTDFDAVLKFIETVLCFIGLIFFQFGTVFYARWVQEMLVLSLECYFLICLLFFMMEVKNDKLSPMANFFFMLTGTVLNLLGGVMTIARNTQKNQLVHWMYIEPGFDTGDDFEILTAAFAILAGVVMLLDTIKSLQAKKPEHHSGKE